MNNVKQKRTDSRVHFIAEWAKKRGLKQAYIVSETGADKGLVSRWFHGGLPSQRYREILAEIFRIKQEALFTNPDNERINEGSTLTPLQISLLSNAHIRGKIEGGNKLIPVYGQAVAGEDGEFVMNGNIVDYISVPETIASSPDAYSVVISGNSMSPRYEEGDIALVTPSRRLIKKGDYVVAQVQTEESNQPFAFIKKFVRHNTTELVLEQFNPPKTLTFAHQHVVSVHYIAGVLT